LVHFLGQKQICSPSFFKLSIPILLFCIGIQQLCTLFCGSHLIAEVDTNMAIKFCLAIFVMKPNFHQCKSFTNKNTGGWTNADFNICMPGSGWSCEFKSCRLKDIQNYRTHNDLTKNLGKVLTPLLCLFYSYLSRQKNEQSSITVCLFDPRIYTERANFGKF
jgi:hypothetical protein